jgi:hypothetical protein
MSVTIDKALTVHPLVLTRQSDYPLPAKPKSYTLKELRENFRCNEDMSSDEVLQKAGELGHAFFHKKQDDRYYSFVPQLGNNEDATAIAPLDDDLKPVVDPASHFVHLEFEPLAAEDLEELDAELDEEGDGEEELDPDIEYETPTLGAAIPVTEETSAPLNLASMTDEDNPLANIETAFEPDGLDF